MIVRDLASDASHEYDVSRLRVFLVTTCVDPKTVATSELGVIEVDQIVAHRGSAQERT